MRLGVGVEDLGRRWASAHSLVRESGLGDHQGGVGRRRRCRNDLVHVGDTEAQRLDRAPERRAREECGSDAVLEGDVMQVAVVTPTTG
ncbi:hypothetical protein ACFV2N_43490 [Streptomyces sp. NPDC059680]|uniref:hypothetical protein n=1 Tax=Streptomyces sp. NPDC059680 TaxID=3346904 RepID=UPI003680F438